MTMQPEERRAAHAAILEGARKAAPIAREIGAQIFAHPELCFEETRAAGWLVEAIERAGISVEKNLGGLPTAFRARIGQGSDGSGSRVAIFAEYDALPEMGHACGHNLIATGALGAFLALAFANVSVPGSIELVGTPAEEGGGGKIKLYESGVLEGVSAAMMFHPYDRDVYAQTSLASYWVRMSFEGVAAHAAMAPWDGKSALAAAMGTMQLVDAQRSLLRDGVRVHGFVVNGGQAVNVIPERAIVDYAVRAPDYDELLRARALVERCARGAALACDVKLSIEERMGYKDMQPNLPLARRFGAHLKSLGREPCEADPTLSMGSTDMGDISHVIPSIHPLLAICDRGASMCHDRSFLAFAGSERGLDAAMLAAQAMALTAFDAATDPALAVDIAAAFASNRPR